MESKSVQILSDLVKINSVYPNEYSLSLFLERYLNSLGFTTKRVYISDNRFNLLARRGHVNRCKILFYGHIDTVAISSINRWKTNPFKLTKIGKRLYGLGSYDMKGGISAFLNTVGNLPDKEVKIMLAVDEENISEGAWKVVDERKNFFKGVELIISSEPNFGMGMNSLTNRRSGRYVYEVEFEGKSAHIAKHNEGIDAIETASMFIINLYKKRKRLFGENNFIQARKIYSESLGMSVSSKAVVEVEVLADFREHENIFKNKLSSLTKANIKLKSRKTPYLSGYSFEMIPYQKLISQIVTKYVGKRIRLNTRLSVGDDNVLATLGIPVITWGPDGGNAHTENEFVYEKSINLLSKMYQDLLENTI